MKSLMILGRQAAIGLAELESLYGPDKVRPAGEHAALLDVDPCLVAFDRLGGSMKFCKVLITLDTVSWKEIERFLIKVSPDHSKQMPEGKMTLGLSVHGLQVTTQHLLATGLSIKKAIRKTGRPVRLVPNKDLELNSAQVLHNNLTNEHGWELVFVRHEEQTIVAQTVKVQDIDSYTIRDRERPKRDARVGMLPPKLAQTIINLATGLLPDEARQSVCEIPSDQQIPLPALNRTVLDPFCGTGVVLQEALLMGYHVYGSDLEKRMVDYTQINLEWLQNDHPEIKGKVTLEACDATAHTWKETIDFVAAETYLGRPFTAMPNPELLQQTMSDCNLIIKKFLQNIHQQIKPGTRLCLAVPAWQIRSNDFKHLPVLDHLEELGYNQWSFEHARNEELIYYRSEQIVARELLIIIKK